jgi:hypothetical protein
MSVRFPPLNLPPRTLTIEMRDSKAMVLCLVRRRWVVLTPEEWVRQHLVAHLSIDLGYPRSLMKLEKSVQGSARAQRADLTIHDRNGSVLMLVECKAPDEPLTQETLFQAGRYNRHIQAGHLLISNGIQHYCCRLHDGEMNFLDHIPFKSELSAI